MRYKIDKLTATVEAPRAPLKAIPGRLTASNVLRTLSQIGITIPEKVATLAASGEQVASADWKVSVAQFDEAIAKNAVLPFAERLRFKFACDRLGLLKI